MPDYVALIRTPGSQEFHFLNAPDLPTAQQRVRDALQNGVSASGGQKEPVQVGIILLAAFAAFNPT